MPFASGLRQQLPVRIGRERAARLNAAAAGPSGQAVMFRSTAPVATVTLAATAASSEAPSAASDVPRDRSVMEDTLIRTL
jgi:hypothetical protein